MLPLSCTAQDETNDSGPLRSVTSPSLRRRTVATAPPSKQATAVGKMFDSNGDLWDVLVSSMVGQHKHNAALASLYATCRESRSAIRVAHGLWRQTLTDRRDDVMEATAALRTRVEEQEERADTFEGRDTLERAVATAHLRMDATLLEAFGLDFANHYSRLCCNCSVYSPKVISAMHKRQCVLCEQPMQPEYKATMQAGSRVREREAGGRYTFGHVRCVGEHCATVIHGVTMHNKKSITHRWRPWLPCDVFTALTAFCSATEFRCSPYVKHVNGGVVDGTTTMLVRRGAVPQTLWVQPMEDVVDWRDTVMGALDVDGDTLEWLLSQAIELQKTLHAKRQIKIEKTQERDELAKQARVGNVRRLIGCLHSNDKIAWKTLDELEALHPMALDRVGVMRYVCENGRVADHEAMGEAIAMLSRFVTVAPRVQISEPTLDFVLNQTVLWANQRVGDQPMRALTNQRARDFVHLLDVFTPAKYHIRKVKISRSFCTWSVSLLTWWSGKQVHTNFTLSRAEVLQSRAQLEQVGCDPTRLPRLDVGGMKDPIEALSSMINEALCVNVTLLGKRYATHPCRSVAYSLLGMQYSLLARMRNLSDAQGVDPATMEHGLAQEFW